MLTLTLNAYCQDSSKISIKFRTGIGISIGNRTDGLGITYSAGFQKEIWNGRFRINPNFSFGQYSSKVVMDARDEYFNSTNLETILSYDLLKGKKASLVIGMGGLINNTRGLLGTGGKTDPDYVGTISSQYISNFHFAGYIGGGLRFSSPNKRISYEIIPFNLHIGTNDFLESHIKIGLEIKL
ncbi:MAG: hypothetical protein IPJ16_08985 [Bacteroidales bacterium]|nr:hypothetical protein [Bacteroidales bacterium]